MMKNILSVIAGLIAGFLVIVIMEAISHKMYPLPPGFDLDKADNEMLGLLMEIMPMGAFMMILIAYSLGSFSGGIISAAISNKIHQPLMVGGVLMLAGIINLLMIRHPVWFAVVSLFMYLPFSFAGGKIGVMIKKKVKK